MIVQCDSQWSFFFLSLNESFTTRTVLFGLPKKCGSTQDITSPLILAIIEF